MPIQLVASDCSICPAGGKRLAAVEDADIVETEKAALKNVSALGILAVHPPGEIQQQFLKNPLEKFAVALAAALFFHFVNAPCRPGMHRRVDVAERPFVRRQLTVGMHVPLTRHQQQLLLGEVGIDQRQRDAVEGQVPGGIPWVLPFVRHGDHVGIVEMAPFRLRPLSRSRGGSGPAGSPLSQRFTS